MKKKNLIGYVTKSTENKYKVLASTNAIDRQGDSIDQKGWDLVNFKKNPVMPFAHNYSALPVGKATSVIVTDKGLECEFEFAPAEGNPVAQQVKVLYDLGYLNAVSVGFIPKTRSGNIITSAELLEISFVPVPANQEALRLTMKAIEENTMLTDEYRAEMKEMFAIVSEKGAVSDELDAEEAMEEKYEKMCEVWEAVNAMCTVYFDDNTAVEDFAKLLGETIILLNDVVTNDGEDDDTDEEKAIRIESVKALFAVLAKKFGEEKAGRKLSKDTMEKMDKAIEHSKNGIAVLEQMKTDSLASEDGKAIEEKEIKVETVKVEVKEDVILLTADDVSRLRQASQIGIRQGEFISGLLKDFLQKRAPTK